MTGITQEGWPKNRQKVESGARQTILSGPLPTCGTQIGMCTPFAHDWVIWVGMSV